MSTANLSPPVPATPPAAAGAQPARRWWRPRRVLVLALLGSLAIHLAASLWPQEPPEPPDATPLTATLRELPPPPVPQAARAPAPPKAKPRPRSPAAPPAPTAAPAAAPEAAPAVEIPAPEAEAAGPTPPAVEPVAVPVLAEDVAAPPSPPAAELKTLPPRVDLAYKIFYGTQGFQIGSATYRFEHANNRYRMSTVGEARGLAALLLRGQGRIESHGLITAAGLQPLELVVDKFNRRGQERAEFDWETGIATLHENQTAALELPTFDPLSAIWAFYFRPPDADRQAFAMATTRRVHQVVGTRERTETIEWANGRVDTEVWHRTSADGKTEAWVWLAPSLRWLPVKMRVTNTTRGTVEALLDAIRVDEPVAAPAQ